MIGLVTLIAKPIIGNLISASKDNLVNHFVERLSGHPNYLLKYIIIRLVCKHFAGTINKKEWLKCMSDDFKYVKLF